jgi:RNA polymerase sigma factor (sigma-70 family)
MTRQDMLLEAIDGLRQAARHMARNPDDADDLAAETVLRALRGLDQFDPSRGTFAGWIHRIMRNAAIDRARAENRRAVVLECDLAAFPELSCEIDLRHVQALVDLDWVRRVSWEILEDEEAIVLELYMMHNETREIAALVGRPAGSVESLLHVAKARIREEALACAY